MNADLLGETEWVEYFDDDNDQPYYYNRVSKTTQYELPEEYDNWKNEEIDKYFKSTNWRRRKDEKKQKYFYFNKKTNKTQWEAPAEQLEFEIFLKQANIDRYEINEEYNYDSQNESGDNEVESKPYNDFAEGLSPTYESEPELEESSMVDAAPRLQRIFSDNAVRDQQDEEVNDHDNREEENRLELDRVIAKLSARDAIMEPTIHKTGTRFLTLAPGAHSEIVLRLTQGYTGFAQMTHLVCDWVNLATEDSGGFDSDNFIADEVSDLIKRKFNKDIVDRLIDKGGSVPAWLHNLMHEPRWRRLLLELFDESANKGSALLGYCIRELSRQGYHREIAHVIRESDYFQVFNDLLKDSIGRFGQALCRDAVDKVGQTSLSGSMHADKLSQIVESETLDAIVGDLKRMCCSSEYMFLYAQAVLVAVENKCLSLSSQPTEDKKRGFDQISCSENDAEDGECIEEANKADEVILEGGTTHAVRTLSWQWAKKMRRLRQEMDQAVLWGTESVMSVDGEATSWTPKSLSQSESFTLRLTELLRASADSSLSGNCSEEDEELEANGGIFGVLLRVLSGGEIMESQIKELCSLWFGVPRRVNDEEFLDRLDNTAIDRLLASISPVRIPMLRTMIHPQMIRILVCALVHPQRSKRLVYSRKRLAALLSFSVAIHEHIIRHESKEMTTGPVNPSTPSERMRVLVDDMVNVAARCAEMTSMMSVSASSSLLEYMKEPVVSTICLAWIRASVSDPFFLSKSLQCSVYAVMLQLIVEAINRYPLQRHDCFDLLQACFKSASEMASTNSSESREISAVKCDVLDIMIHLAGVGYVTGPLNFISDHICDSCYAKFDTALIRHVVVKLLTSIAPPYSPEFACKLLDILLQSSSKKAMESQHFAGKGVKALLQFRDALVASDIVSDIRFQEFNKLVEYSGKGSSTSFRY